MRIHWRKLALCSGAMLGSLAIGMAGHAQTDDDGGSTYDYATIMVEHIERQNVSERLQPHDDGLLGDQIDPNTGTVVFRHLDVSLPGNFDLPVAIHRTRAPGFAHAHVDALTVNATITNGFSDWTLDVPRIEMVGLYSDSGSDFDGQGFCQAAAVGGAFYTPPPGPPSLDDPFFYAYEFSNGMSLIIPGHGSQRVLHSPSGLTWPADTVRTTKDYWAIACGPNDYGFIVTAPNGDRYTFERFARRPETGIPVQVDNHHGAMGRARNVSYISEITDIHGNWVRYDYDSNARPIRIHASDGREILINRDGDGLIQTITAEGRTWTYNYEVTYDGWTLLSSVTLPDGRQWSFDMKLYTLDADPDYDCEARDTTVSLTHPDGITGSFTFSETRHLKGYTATNDRRTSSCLVGGGQHIPYYDHMSLISRTLSGPGYPSATWTYAYSGYSGGTVPETKWGEMTDPAGTRTRRIYHRGGDLEGLELRTEIYSGSTRLRSVEYEYIVEDPLGVTYLENENQAKMANPRHVVRTTVTEGGVSYVTDTGYNSLMSAADYSFGRPVSVSRSSPLQADTRTTETTYTHLLSDWILGLPAEVTRNGILTESNTYSAAGQRTRQDRFGTLYATYGYYADGTLAWVQDALSRRVVLNDYHRGTPRSVTRPDGVVLSRLVDGFGRLTRQTDANGNSVSYAYDSGGRLTRIDRPSPHSDTTISYSGLGSGLRQVATRGPLSTIVDYDAMLRAWLVEQRPVSGSSVFTRSRFDALNRTVFTAFPATSSTASAGVETTYDPLGRVIQTRETVSPYATTSTAYLSGNRVRVTDPSGAVTTTTRSGYGSPHDGEEIRIAQPEGVVTTMEYDAFGNLTRATQGDSTLSFTQSWGYDSHQRPCRHHTPETGTTLYGYDAAGQRIALSRGESASAACGAFSASARIDYAYDSLGRLTSIDYPSGTADTSFTYDLNGNTTRAAHGAVVWDYAYDTGDQLTGETLFVDARSYQTSYAYTADGALASRTTPAGRVIEARPDDFGRPTGAFYGNWQLASNVTYHPSGAVSRYSSHNGHTYSATFDARHQMSAMRVASSTVTALDFAYGRDVNGRVTAIADYAVSGQDRSFAYDGLGRLIDADGPWGEGFANYDALNNLLYKGTLSFGVELEYDASNRLIRHRNTSAGNVWQDYSYDARGNVTGNGPLSFTYDLSNRPVSISGAASGSFVYDAHGRRVKQTIDGQTIYSVYNRAGTLIYRDNVSAGQATDYIAMGTRTIARILTGGGTSQVIWVYSDHLGSASTATDRTGTVLWRENYTPFGRPLQDPAQNQDDMGFTGHVRDSATGLTYAQARYYDPVIGRFLSSDPVGFATGGPGYFNQYAYVGNDPVNKWDPFGEEAFLGGRAAGGGYSHLYVAVVDDDGGVTIYSAGPSTGSGAAYITGDPELRPMADVQATDAAAFARDRNNSDAVVQLPSEISDETVHAVGAAALGHDDYDTGLNPARNGQDGANSNSFARAIVNRSAAIEGVDPNQIVNPQGNYPLVEAADRVEFDEEQLQQGLEN